MLAIIAIGGNSLIKDKEHQTVPDQYEADNGFYQSTVIAIDTTAQNHSIHNNDNSDYFRVNLQEGQTYTIETHIHPTNANTVDTMIVLYDADFNVIEINDDSGSGLYSKIIYNCTETVKYYIVIVPCLYGTDLTGYYSIDVRLGSYGSSNTNKSIDIKKEKKARDNLNKRIKKFK